MLHKRRESPQDGQETLQLTVPRRLQAELLAQMHNSMVAGHLGVKKTTSRINRQYYWYGMKEAITLWVRKCTRCGARKRPLRIPRAPLGDYRSGAQMDRVATDILGPLPLSEQGNHYVLVVMDCFSRWTEAYPIPDFSAKTVADVLVNQFFSRFGCSLELHSDQGRTYESQLFTETMKLLGIHKTRSSLYHPASNVMVERFNSTLLSMISVFIQDNQSSWDKNLPLLTAAYRPAKHESTGFSPNLLFLGRETNLPIDLTLGVSNPGQQPECDYLADLQERMTAIYATVRANLKKYSQTEV